MSSKRLLCISNGHGEDAIALRILQALAQQAPEIELGAIAMVGEGAAYRRAGISLVGPTQTLPSGGFIYMDRQQLAKDVGSGLVQLTWRQIQAARAWANQGGVVFAVGDVVPQLVAWLSGANYGAIATAKSEYWLRDELGPLPHRPWYEGWAGSVFLPWERWLLGHRRCRVAFVRDGITADWLVKTFQIPAVAANPMMDGLEPDAQRCEALNSALGHPDLILVLLPGSRSPECLNNWPPMLRAVDGVLDSLAATSVGLLAAIAPSLPLADFRAALTSQGWDPKDEGFCKANGRLLLVNDGYAECLDVATAAIATAGTATEQVVGLGKPAFTFPGSGPQFTRTFAETQGRLLGPSVVLVDHPAEVGPALEACLQDTERLQQIKVNGRRRLGEPGAAETIATHLRQHLIAPGIS
ncbi:hypothetical protein C7271_25375 [filamentous cyanobacterium CCP5]|nr:hypothetical protein C7271_25375 [filamentous cyanobacterium CCP5]